MSPEHEQTLENLLHERRKFPPSAEFVAAANRDVSIYDDAANDRLGFWEQAASDLTWSKPWHTVLDWQVPNAKWFVGGELNVSENCLRPGAGKSCAACSAMLRKTGLSAIPRLWQIRK